MSFPENTHFDKYIASSKRRKYKRILTQSTVKQWDIYIYIYFTHGMPVSTCHCKRYYEYSYANIKFKILRQEVVSF